MQLSAVVITRNEEDNIKRCLQSVAFADERIVVDAESTDKTAQLAREAGATVFVRPWPGYGPQKNFGRTQAKGEWLLFIDADEEVTPDLRELIIQAMAKPDKDFYWLRIVTVFLGRPLWHLYGHNPRLMRRASGQWNDGKVHEQVETNMGERIALGDEHSAVLKAPLMHYSHPTVQSYLAKMHGYTTLDAQEIARTGHHRSGRHIRPSYLMPPWLAARQFLKLFLYRRGVLDGPAGWLWCVLSGYYEFEMGRKYLAKIDY